VAGGTALTLASTGTEGESTGRIQVRMKPGSGTAAEEGVIARLRSRLENSDRARFEFERATYFSFRTPVEVEVYGDQLVDLFAAAAAVEGRLAGIPGLADVRSSPSSATRRCRSASTATSSQGWGWTWNGGRHHADQGPGGGGDAVPGGDRESTSGSAPSSTAPPRSRTSRI